MAMLNNQMVIWCLNVNQTLKKKTIFDGNQFSNPDDCQGLC